MKITFEAEPKEIAALIVAVQGQQKNMEVPIDELCHSLRSALIEENKRDHSYI